MRDNMNYFPKISIVTVVFNDVKSIENTLLSVIKQTYRNKEYIIIDGGSDDGTCEIIKKHLNSINSFVSEPDLGIYDAMNKGLSIANGSWVIFINSGDEFFNYNVLTDIFINQSENYNNIDVIYSDAIAINEKKELRVRAQPLKRMWLSLITSHQAIFVRLSLIKTRGFDLRFKICSDYDLIYELYAAKGTFLYMKDIIIAKYTNDKGFSRSISIYKILRESILITNKYGSWKDLLKKYFFSVLGVMRIKFSLKYRLINQ